MDVDTPTYNKNIAVNSGFFILKTEPNMKHIIREWAFNNDLYNSRYGFSVGKDVGLFQH